ncbi:MAG TPA: hypothetical protein VJM49_10650, partial [Acidimicrobiales bacterium]|nr:hypothetical protein [Acidimicrobiales bacterium]
RTAERAVAFGDRHGIPRRHGSYEDLAADGRGLARREPPPGGVVAGVRAGRGMGPRRRAGDGHQTGHMSRH